MELEFRRAGAGDSARLAGIAAESFLDPWTEASFGEELARPRCAALVACGTGGTPIGYALGWRVLEEVQLLSIAVKRDWRRRGVGGALLARFFEVCRCEGAARVTLEVRAGNAAAQALYRKLGMACEGTRPRYYAGRESALLYGTVL